MTAIFVALSLSNRSWKDKDSQSLGPYNKAPQFSFSMWVFKSQQVENISVLLAGKEYVFSG